jgi:phasin
MTGSPFEIPNEVRDLAERSVEQTRKAFEGLLSIAERAAEAAGEAAEASQGGAKSIGAHMLAYTEQNANAAFDVASKLVRAKDPQEALTLQNDYLKGQFAALQTQAKELGGILQKSVAVGSY